MGQTLTNGVYLPDNGERNCYTGLSQNWQKLDNLLGNKGDKVSFAQTLTEGVEIGKITINGVDIAMYHTDYSGKADADNVYSKAEADTLLDGKADKATTLSGYGITDAYTKTQVENKISELVNSAPETLDTLNELASALGNDPNFASTVANQIGTKANDSSVVHKTGNETISGAKSFINGIITYVTSNNSDNGYTSVFGGTNAYKGAWIELVGKDHTIPTASGTFEIIASNGDGVRKSIRGCPDGSLFWSGSSFICPNGDLGTSSKKWKSFNGTNPGALSLPGTSVNIDTTNWVLDGSGANSFTPTSDGWIGIQCTDTVYDQTHYVFVGRIGGGDVYYQQNTISPVNALWDNRYHGCVFIPVIKDMNYHIRCVCNALNAKFFPCQGNV